jgi:hypothetical protein
LEGERLRDVSMSMSMSMSMSIVYCSRSRLNIIENPWKLKIKKGLSRRLDPALCRREPGRGLLKSLEDRVKSPYANMPENPHNNPEVDGCYQRTRDFAKEVHVSS